ncbi:ABC transporter ATP-binding protein [Tessaracoccus sp. MC1679]|uniref:energy-coupling factor ABC transporter ATP-binding protein n=1 Tax=Tessaracoccus sp. MC1679 TaxID=2760313 RepID=UPI0015FEC489|nr:ABC transporter ATP-binding protein [Tessaracoccus sp. MC1679]MBB1516445.1 ABC transporter ATP-binding protein [Tessaracoccus sp. MC1679]
MISLRGVTVVIPAVRRGDADRVLLHPVTLDLAEPRIALVGANGSGKSTLLRLLNGLRRPTVGTVTVDGLDTVKDARAVRARVGFVFTDPLAQLLMSTPIEDVELSLRGRIRGRAERNRRAQEMLDARGLGHLAHQSIYDLSGGERQLVALTSVLAVEPSILVADEPTTLLDLRNRRELRRTFAELGQQIIFSTHDLDIAADADRVIVVHEGRVVADGVPAEALAAYEAVVV